MATALIFPGQGSQTPGMGKALSETFASARDVFSQVDDELGENLSRLIFDGPEAELTLTANAQPALMAVSLAAMRVLELEAGLDLKRDIAFVAGHSLGEYSALAAAGSLGIADAARLLRLRGEAMQRAVAPGEGAMAALLGIEPEAAARVADAAAVETGLVCQVANDNGGGQVVVSGDKAAVGRAMELAKAAGARRAVLLQVSAPFHCALMQPAAAEMQAALAEVRMGAPKVPLVANVLAAHVRDPSQIKPLLVRQVTGTVRWRESVAFMAANGVTHFVEVGAGKVLAGPVKRIAEGATSACVGTPADVEAFRARI